MYHDPNIQRESDKVVSHLKGYTEEEIIELQEMWHKQEERYRKGEEVANQIAQLVNTMDHNSPEERAVMDTLLLRTHRTLQQSVISLFLRVMYGMAEKQENWYDLRNEAAVMTCRKIKTLLGEKGYLLPLI